MVDLFGRSEKIKMRNILEEPVKQRRRHIDVEFVERKIRIDLKNDTTQRAGERVQTKRMLKISLIEFLSCSA